MSMSSPNATHDFVLAYTGSMVRHRKRQRIRYHCVRGSFGTPQSPEAASSHSNGGLVLVFPFQFLNERIIKV